MRPVNKGDSPYQAIKSYGDALPYLKKRLGAYCSYCEQPIDHVPEVEHLISKTRGGDETAWENLLLGCKYCNTRKANTTSLENWTEYLWPNRDNTAMAYTYQNGFPRVNQALLEIDPDGDFYKKAQNLYDLVGLDHVTTEKDKDNRFVLRNAAYTIATAFLEDWEEAKKRQDSFLLEICKKHIEVVALKYGFFSVWMTTFSNEPEILQMLIEKFPNTRKECFDERGNCRFDASFLH